MVEVLSMVNFDNQDRIDYLQRSFKSFYKYNKIKKHIVIDGSKEMGRQQEIYEELNIEYYHQPISMAQRLKFGVSLMDNDYFVFLPDDYEWIFDFPTEEAIKEAKKNDIKELKLVCPPMQWFSEKEPIVEKWYDEDFKLKQVLVPTQSGNILKRVFWDFHTWFTSGEQLVQKDDLFISYRHYRRSFMQQFSLGCHIIETNFMKNLCVNMPDDLPSAGSVEKYVYKKLLFRPYLTAYYKMLTPAFHFIQLEVEGQEKAHIASTNLIAQNYKYFQEN